MKNLTSIIISLSFLSGFAQNSIEIYPKEPNDTIRVNYRIGLQKLVNVLIKEKTLSFKNEDIHSGDLLEKSSDAETYAKLLIYNRYPEIKNSPQEFYMSEDSTKKLWFIYMYIPNALDGGIYMIMIKNNGKILFFNNFCCPK